MRLYPFSIQFVNGAARFPFYFKGKPLQEVFCALSSRSFGNILEFDDGRYPVREKFYQSQGYNPVQCYACTQIHSRTILVIDENTPNNYPEGDGLLTRNPSLALSVTIADCLPVFLFDTKNGAMGMLHSGWKGTGIVKNAVERMKHSFNTEAKNVAAVLGPCIQSCCYQVDEKRAEMFETEFGSIQSGYPLGPVTKRVNAPDENRYLCYLDLQAANTALLEEAGIEHVAYTRNCTFTDDRFGSFRREGNAYTRMAALIGTTGKDAE